MTDGLEGAFISEIDDVVAQMESADPGNCPAPQYSGAIMEGVKLELRLRRAELQARSNGSFLRGLVKLIKSFG